MTVSRRAPRGRLPEYRDDGRLRPRRDRQLDEDVGDMLLHGPFRDEETAGYHCVRLAVSQRGEDIALALRQKRQVRVTHPWRKAGSSMAGTGLFMIIISVC